MKFGNKLTCPGLQRYPCVDLSMSSLVCPEALGQSWRWGGQGHPFPGCAGNCHVVGRGRGRLEPEPSVSKGFLLCSVAVPTLLGQVSPKMLEQNSESWVQIGSTPCKCAPPPPHWHICSPATAIDIPGTLQFKLRVKWNRYQSPGSSQVGWNLATRFLITLVWGRQLGADHDCTAPGRRRVQVSNTWWNFLLLCSGFFPNCLFICCCQSLFDCFPELLSGFKTNFSFFSCFSLGEFSPPISPVCWHHCTCQILFIFTTFSCISASQLCFLSKFVIFCL